MNISLQVKKIYYTPLRALTIISKVTVSVSKYKPLNNIKCLCNNCFFLQCRLKFVKTVENTLCTCWR